MIDLDTHYPLTAAQLEAFDKDGFIHLTNVLSPETLEHYAPAITEQTFALNTETRPFEERNTYDRAFLQVMNLWRHGGLPRGFVFGRRLARIAAELLGVRGVRLYHDQALYKEPGGGITPAHADQYYWPFSSDKTVTAWIPLQTVGPEMGPLAFFAGSHHAELGRNLPISDESEARISDAMASADYRQVDEPFNLGDVSFHRGWTFHRAGENKSSSPRAVMTMIYVDQDITVAQPTNQQQETDLVMWCPGARVGEVLSTPLNPVLFSFDQTR